MMVLKRWASSLLVTLTWSALGAPSALSHSAEEYQCVPNPNYAAEMAEYDAQVAEYSKDLAAYNTAVAEYTKLKDAYWKQAPLRSKKIGSRIQELVESASKSSSLLAESTKNYDRAVEQFLSMANSVALLKDRRKYFKYEIDNMRIWSKKIGRVADWCSSDQNDEARFEPTYYNQALKLYRQTKALSRYLETNELASQALPLAAEFVELQDRKSEFCSKTPRLWVEGVRLDGNWDIVQGVTRSQQIIAGRLVPKLEAVLEQLKAIKETSRMKLDQVGADIRDQAVREAESETPAIIVPERPRRPMPHAALPEKELCEPREMSGEEIDTGVDAVQ